MEATRHARHRLPLALAVLQAAGLVACIAAYQATGLTVAWTTLPLTLPLIVVAAGTWLATRRRTETDAALALTLVLSFSTIVLFLQYPALAAGRPLIDDTLLRVDDALGMSAAGMMAWTIAHPALNEWLQSAYSTLGLQMVIALVIVAARRDRATLWEFVVHYHVCLGISLAICALWPANEPWFHTRLPDIADETRIVGQIAGLHSGSLRIVDVSALEGLVTMPSFHVAAAWMATWALRRCRPALVVFVPLNVLLTASTFMLGMHYVVDAVAGFALLGLSIAAYRVVGMATETGRFARVAQSLDESAPLVSESSRALVAD